VISRICVVSVASCIQHRVARPSFPLHSTAAPGTARMGPRDAKGKHAAPHINRLTAALTSDAYSQLVRTSLLSGLCV
jgi:hypothetical protein